MSTPDFQSGIEELRGVFDKFKREVASRSLQGGTSLLNLLASRVIRAIDEGMPVLEREGSRRGLSMPASRNRWTDASLVHALELDLNREEDTALRWLLISYWVALCNFDAIDSNVGALAVSSLDDLTWLVAGALWVQWASGQPTTHQLRAALVRLQAAHPELDKHLAAMIAGPPGAIREAAETAERLLTDPSANLPTELQ